MSDADQTTGFICQILILDTMETAGVGALVTEKHVLTCAHVVNRALGRKIDTKDKPDRSSHIQVYLPLADPTRVLTAALENLWLPPSITPGFGDLAGLVLVYEDPDTSGVRPAILADAPPIPDDPVRVFGYSGDPPRSHGSWVSMWWRDKIGNGLVQLDQRLDSVIRAQPGFSGSPVLARGAGGVEVVVGIFQAAPKDKDYRDGYALPVGPRLREFWPAVLQADAEEQLLPSSTRAPAEFHPRSGSQFRVRDFNSKDLARVVAAACQLAERDNADVSALIQRWDTKVKERAARFVLAQHAEGSASLLLEAIDKTTEWGGPQYFRGMAAADLVSPPHAVYLSESLEDRLARVYAKARLRANIVATGRAGVTSAASRLTELARNYEEYETFSINALAYLYRSACQTTPHAEHLRESILTELGAVLPEYSQAKVGAVFHSLQPVHADALLSLWISSDREVLTRHAARALGAMRLSRARQRMADRAATATPPTAQVLLCNIGAIGGEASVELLLDRLEGSSSDAAHEGLLRCIEDAPDDAFEAIIPDLLRKPSQHRWRAIRAVGMRRFEPALDRVREALTSDLPLERGSAALALARITSRRDLTFLEETRADATDYFETVMCTEALLIAAQDENLVKDVNDALLQDYQIGYLLLDRELVEDAISTLETAGGIHGRECAQALNWMTAQPANED